MEKINKSKPETQKGIMNTAVENNISSTFGEINKCIKGYFFLIFFYVFSQQNRFCHFAKVNCVEFLVTPVMHCLTYTDFCIVSLDSMYLKSI